MSQTLRYPSTTSSCDRWLTGRIWEGDLSPSFLESFGVKAVARLCDSDITDSQSGFRLIRAEVLKEIDLSTSRFETELELLIKACKKGFGVLSVRINTQKVDGTGSSHFRPVVDTWLVCKVFL